MNNCLSPKCLLTAVLTLFSIIIYAQDNFGGLALYTVRQEMEKDARATLQKVAETGYAYIEAADYNKGKFYGMEPLEFKSYLKSIGLSPVSTQQLSVTLENLDQQIADVKKAGFEYFSIPVPPMGMMVYNRESKTTSLNCSLEDLAKILTVFGKKCDEAGLKLLYHNHDFEFKENEEGIRPIDYLLENTDPKYVNFQMDIYWVTKAEVDPVDYFEKYPGRFKSWHVKDMDDEGKFAPVGEGTIDFKRILAEKKVSGMDKYFVEQDETWDKKPMDAIRTSHKGLKELGFD